MNLKDCTRERLLDYLSRQIENLFPDGQIGVGVRPDDVRCCNAAVGKLHANVRGFLDDVMIRYNVSRGVDDHAGS